LWSSPGLLSAGAVVCVDMTPFKGQPPTRYLKYGFPHRWQSSSGLAEIEALRQEFAAGASKDPGEETKLRALEAAVGSSEATLMGAQPTRTRDPQAPFVVKMRLLVAGRGEPRRSGPTRGSSTSRR